MTTKGLKEHPDFTYAHPLYLHKYTKRYMMEKPGFSEMSRRGILASVMGYPNTTVIMSCPPLFRKMLHGK